MLFSNNHRLHTRRDFVDDVNLCIIKLELLHKREENNLELQDGYKNIVSGSNVGVARNLPNRNPMQFRGPSLNVSMRDQPVVQSSFFGNSSIQRSGLKLVPSSQTESMRFIVWMGIITV